VDVAETGMTIRVAFKLFASLSDYLPPGNRGNRVELALAPGTTVGEVIAHHRVPEKSAHLVLVNGVFIPPAARGSHRLQEGDELACWPPIAGG
jgi:sulfur carrier protein ThiS